MDGPVLTKEIPVGGVLITEEIQRQMGVSYEEAEDLKLSQDDKGNLPEEILSIIQVQTQSQMEEIRKVLNFFIAAGSSEQAGFCFVTGGNSLLPGILPALEDLVGIEVRPINLFDVIEFDKKAFTEDALEVINATGMVSIGPWDEEGLMIEINLSPTKKESSLTNIGGIDLSLINVKMLVFALAFLYIPEVFLSRPFRLSDKSGTRQANCPKPRISKG